MEIGDVEKANQRWLRKQMGYWASSLRIIKVSCEHRRDADKENRVSEGIGSTRAAERFVVLFFFSLGTQNPKQDGTSNLLDYHCPKLKTGSGQHSSN